MLWDVLAWDSALVAWCASVRTDGITITGIWTSELASAGAVAGVVAVVGYLLYRSNRLHDLAGLVVSAGGSVLAAHLLKLATDRLRPPISVAAYIEAVSAFPSAHAAVAVGLYGFLAWLLWRDCDRQWWHRAAVVGTIALAAVIGASRILLGRPLSERRPRRISARRYLLVRRGTRHATRQKQEFVLTSV